MELTPSGHGHVYGPLIVHDTGVALQGDVGVLNVNTNNHNYQTVSVHSERSLLQSLCYPEMEDRRNEIKDHEQHTFDWLYQTVNGDDESSGHYMTRSEGHVLLTWIKHGDGIFAVLGKPGAGKSTFMKFLSTDPRLKPCLEIWAATTKVHVAFHSFWGLSKRPDLRNRKGLMASLAFQIIKKDGDLCTQLDQLHRERQSYQDWSESTLETLLDTAVELSKYKMLLLIDALDEAEPGVVQSILQWTERITTRHNGKCKICLASRPLALLEYVQIAQTMYLHDHTAPDMRLYTRKRLHQHYVIQQKLHNSEDNFKIRRLIALLCEKAEGVWVWLYHVMARIELDLEIQNDVDAILKTTEKLPENVSDLFRSSLARSRRKYPGHENLRTMLFNLSHEFPCPLFQLAVAVNSDSRDLYLAKQSSQGELYAADICHTFTRRLYELSGCLLECADDVQNAMSSFREIWSAQLQTSVLGVHMNGGQQRENGWLNHEAIADYFREQQWRGRVVRFVHRTVYEFLHEEGEIATILPSKHARASIESRLACYFEDVLPLNLYAMRELVMPFDDLRGTDRNTIITVNSVCQQQVSSRLGRLTSHPSVGDLSLGKWAHALFKDQYAQEAPLFPLTLDYAGMLAYRGTLNACLYLVVQQRRKFSRYYLSYLARCAIMGHRVFTLGNEALEYFLNALEAEGADLEAVHVGSDRELGTGPFRAESCLASLLTMSVVDILIICNRGAQRKFPRRVISKSVWQLRYLDKYDLRGHKLTFTTCQDGEETDPLFHSMWCHMAALCWGECVTLLTYEADKMFAILKEFCLNQEYDFVTEPERASMLLERVFLLDVQTRILIDKAGKLQWQSLNSSNRYKADVVRAAVFGNNMEYVHAWRKAAAEAVQEQQLESDFGMTCNILFDVPYDTEVKPLDPFKEMQSNDWKDVCVLRDYYAETRTMNLSDGVEKSTGSKRKRSPSAEDEAKLKRVAADTT